MTPRVGFLVLKHGHIGDMITVHYLLYYLFFIGHKSENRDMSKIGEMSK